MTHNKAKQRIRYAHSCLRRYVFLCHRNFTNLATLLRGPVKSFVQNVSDAFKKSAVGKMVVAHFGFGASNKIGKLVCAKPICGKFKFITPR